jgi:Type IV secretion-system coupling protein DNA-binding domain.
MSGLFDRFLKFLSGRYFFVPSLSLAISDLHFKLSKGTLNMTSLITGGGMFKKIDIISTWPEAWHIMKSIYYVASIVGIIITIDLIYRNIFNKLLPRNNMNDDTQESRPPPYPYDEDKLQMIIGLKHKRLSLDKVMNPSWVIVEEKGMYQNFLITGTIGTGKTASAMYPFTKQAMFYKAYDPKMKPGMLILDVKGNFYKQAVMFAENAGRQDDIIIIELNGEYKYNPVYKPSMRPLVLANRSKTVLSLFSPRGASDGYWLDKAELLIAECIKLSRLYNNGYTTFVEINKLVNNKAYLNTRISELLDDSRNAMLTDEEEEEFETSLDYFDNEYTNLSENTLSIIQSVVTQMTQFFYTDPEIRNTFSPSIEELNFHGFQDVIDRGRIVILKMNIAQYRYLAKTIAAYMKLEFQSEVMQRLTREGANTERPVFFFADEYQEFVTSTDTEFYAQSREPKCVNIVATQSYTSLINTLRDRDVVRTISQNLINKIWLRTDDLFTVEEAQKQTGREDKEKISRSISENAGDVKKSRVLGTLVADKSSVSETINVNTVREYVFDEKLFTQQLDVFTGICFLSDGAKILEPTVVHLQPYFSDTIRFGIKKKASWNSNEVVNPIATDEIVTVTSKKAEGEAEGGGAVREKFVEKEVKKNDRKINLRERGAFNEVSKIKKDSGITRNEDFL